MEQKAWNAKRVGMVLLALVMAASALLFATGCSSQSNQKESSDPITMVWLPDNSSADLTQSREAIGDVIKEATGREDVYKRQAEVSRGRSRHPFRRGCR